MTPTRAICAVARAELLVIDLLMIGQWTSLCRPSASL